MQPDSERIHVDVDEARAASTPNVVRWVLAISLLAAIVLLTAIWLIGAWSSDQNTNTVGAQVRAQQDAASGDTIPPAYGTQPNAQPSQSEEPLNMPNKNAASGQ